MYQKLYSNIYFLEEIDASTSAGKDLADKLEQLAARLQSYCLNMVFDNFGALYAYQRYQAGNSRFKDYEKFKHYYQAKAFELGVEIEDALKFTNLYQIEKYLGRCEPHYIVIFKHQYQVISCEPGVEIEDALKFTNLYHEREREVGATIYDYLIKFTDDGKVKSYKAGFKREDALKFTNKYQARAFEAGVKNIDDALKFTNESQVEAFEAGVKIEDALKFTDYAQVEAFEAGVKIEDALKFTDYAQVEAFEAGVKIEDALKFTNKYQAEAYKAGVKIEDAVKIKYGWQIIEVVQNQVPVDDVTQHKYQWYLPKFKNKNIDIKHSFDGVKTHYELSELIKENFELININSDNCDYQLNAYDMNHNHLLHSVYCDVKEQLDTNNNQTIDYIEE